MSCVHSRHVSVLVLEEMLPCWCSVCACVPCIHVSQHVLTECIRHAGSMHLNVCMVCEHMCAHAHVHTHTYTHTYTHTHTCTHTHTHTHARAHMHTHTACTRSSYFTTHCRSLEARGCFPLYRPSTGLTRLQRGTEKLKSGRPF